MLLRRLCVTGLRRVIGTVWATDGRDVPTTPSGWERILPSGRMHLALRLGAEPIRILRAGQLTSVGWTVASGARAEPYAKEVAPAPGVGVDLEPGMSEPLLGVAASELAGRHWSLDEIWGRTAVEELQAGLAACPTLEARLALLEALLRARLTSRPPREGTLDLGQTVRHLSAGGRVADAVRLSGMSHRHFVHRFRTAVGLAPKEFARVTRFQRALHALAIHSRGLADLADAAGYSDQAHLTRDFVEFSGLTPTTYLELAPASANHVPCPPPIAGSDFFKTDRSPTPETPPRSDTGGRS